jgi:hypothetical protein
MANVLKGKRCAVTGALSGMSRRDAEAKLIEVGAKPTKTVSTRTHYLIAGYGAGSKIDKAQAAGVRVINQDQFEALLAGGTLEELDALEPEVEEIEEVPLADALGQLRALIYDEPGVELWVEICELLEYCTDEDLPVAVDYVIQTTSHWPSQVTFRRYGIGWSAGEEHRVAPEKWTNAILNGEDSPMFRMVRALDLSGRDLVGKVANRMFSCSHLTEVRYLQLARNKKLPGSFYRQLLQSEQFANLTHLNLVDCKLPSSAIKAFAEPSVLTDVTHLSIHEVRFDKEGDAKMLLEQPVWQKLEHLDAGYCRNANYDTVGHEIAEALFNAPFRDTLVYLDVHANYMGRGKYIPFLENGAFAHLEHLDLGSNELTDEYAVALANASQLTKLKVLRLSGASFSKEHTAQLVEAGHWGALEELVMHMDGVGDTTLQGLANNQRLSNIHRLHLGAGSYQVASVLALFRATHFAKLSHLRLFVNGAELDDVVYGLCEAEHLKNLEDLALYSDADLSDEGWAALAAAPHLTKLTHVYFGSSYTISEKARGDIASSPYLTESAKENILRYATES